jgi:hypothetical protein
VCHEPPWGLDFAQGGRSSLEKRISPEHNFFFFVESCPDLSVHFLPESMIMTEPFKNRALPERSAMGGSTSYRLPDPEL